MNIVFVHFDSVPDNFNDAPVWLLVQVELEKLRLLCERIIKREKVKVSTCETY